MIEWSLASAGTGLVPVASGETRIYWSPIRLADRSRGAKVAAPDVTFAYECLWHF